MLNNCDILIDSLSSTDSMITHNIFQKLKNLRTDFNMQNVTSDMIILFDKQHGGFYNPEKNNKLYQYVAYDRFFDTKHSLRECLRSLLGLGKSYLLKHYESTIIKELKESAKDFTHNVQETCLIDRYVSEIKLTINILSLADNVFKIVPNREAIKDLWNECYDPLVTVLATELTNAKNMYYYDKKICDVITTLVRTYKKQKDDPEFSKNSHSHDSIFNTTFWLLPQNLILSVINNEEKINEQLRRITFTTENRDLIFLTDVTMMYYNIPWTLYYKYRHCVNSGDRKIISEYLEFCNKITNLKYVEQVKSASDYSYIVMILNPTKRDKLITDIKSLSDIYILKNLSRVSSAASSLKDEKLLKAVRSVRKRQNTGDLTKDFVSRPIMSIHFKDTEKYKQDPEFLSLTSEQRSHFDNYLNDKNSFKNFVTYYRDDGKVFELTNVPELIFKIFNKETNQNKSIYNKKDKVFRNRCRTHAFARAVVKYYNFDKLIVPRFGYFSTDKIDVIYEEKIDINPSQDVQEEYYFTYASRMKSTIYQLTKFGCLTGLDDIAWRNIPLENKSLLDTKEDVKIVLVDFGEIEFYCNFIFGGAFNRLGLIRCVDSSLFDIIKSTFIEITGEDYEYRFDNCSTTRLSELKNDKDMRDYFVSKNITKQNPYQHVPFNVSSELKFDEYDETDQKILHDLCSCLMESFNTHYNELAIKNKELNSSNTNKELDNSKQPLKCTRQISIEKTCLRHTAAHTNKKTGKVDYYDSLTPNEWISDTRYIYTKKEKDEKDINTLYYPIDNYTYAQIALNELVRTGAIFKFNKTYMSVIV